MTSYIKTNESWIHEASQKALEQLRLRWKERVDTWVAKVNFLRSKPCWFGLVKGLEPTQDRRELEAYADEHSLSWHPRHNGKFISDESRLLALINATKAESLADAFLSIEDSVLINKYSRG